MQTAGTTAIPAPVAAGGGRSVVLAGRRYRVLLPRISDPRLHVAAVIVSVQVLGQVVLGFDVSIAQILLAIGTAAVLELTIVAVTTATIAWPASALLTGNGVALLLRTPGTVHGDWWSTRGWPIFVAAAGISLLSKYAIRVGDRHLFNPSNFGLVVVFLAFGSARADPQDLWWGPWTASLAFAVILIVVGGITLSMRLRLFSVALTFWATFAASIAVLAMTGHAITARWHIGPVDGWTFWSVFVLSPEVMIFVFFMITDPRTAPVARAARPAYAAAVGLLAGILVGFQRTEFAAKVSLLLALTLVCAARPLLERRLADDRFAGPGGRWWRRVEPAAAPRPTALAMSVGAVAMAVGLVAVAAAGSTTDVRSEAPLAAVGPATGPGRPKVVLAPGAVPPVVLDPAFDRVAGSVSPAEAQAVGRDLVENLAIEGDAIRTGTTRLARSSSVGPRLVAIGARIARPPEPGRVVVPRYAVQRLRLVLLQDPVAPQAVPNIGVLVHARRTDVVHLGTGRGRIVEQRTTLVDELFLVLPVGDHHLIADQLDPASPMVVSGRRGPP